MKHIRDSLYNDYIEVQEDELPVLSSPYVQRLRRVHQLGLSFMVYPGASHTRFEHSLGVMHLAGQMAESLGLSDEEVEAYRMGGLLHDTGHAPFSHATERLMEREMEISHEEMSCRIVDELSDELPVDAERVKEVIRGETKYDIVAGDIDVDRMDYLRRDSMRTGLEHGRIDTSTIINFATATNEGELVFEKSSLQALEGLFHARFKMTKSVYSHHTSKIAEAMLERAVDAYLETEDFEEIAQWDDYQLHAFLLADDGYAGELYTRIANRDLYKRAVFLSDMNFERDELRRLHYEIDDRRAVEQEIAEHAGVDERYVVVDPPEPPADVEMDVKVNINGSVQPFSELSTVTDHLDEAEWRNTILGVYCPEEYVGDIRESAIDVLDL